MIPRPKRNQRTCYCGAYHFPHRYHSGRCEACPHGKAWTGLSDGLDERCEWCGKCAYEEGYRGEPSECLTNSERNPSLH